MEINSSITMNIDSMKLESKVHDLFDDATMTQIHKLLADTVDPWTPFLTGRLHSDLTITPDYVQYNVPYAKYKYYGQVNCKEFHPLATSHWDEVALQTEMDTFVNGVREILVNRAKELYG